MSYSFMHVKIGELVVKANTGLDAIKRAPIVSERTGIKCLRIQDISQKKGYSDWGNTLVSDSDFNNFKLNRNDILIARTGATIGVSKIIKNNYDSVYNNGLIRLIPNINIVNPFYLYYNLLTPTYKGHIYSISGGTATQPNMRINHLLDYNIQIPELKIQNKISSILLSLDNKIELNNKINDNLEELAQTLYKHWFVDFEFPNEEGLPYKSSGGKMVESELGLIPEGWNVEYLNNLFNFVGGSQPPKKEHIYEYKEGYVRFIQNRDYSGNK